MPVGGSGAQAYLGPWTDKGWNVASRFNTPQAQDWMVQAEIAAVAPVGLKILAGKTSVTCAVPTTGGEAVWQTIDLGRISLNAGVSTIIFSAESKGWQPINLRNVTLRTAP
jgi:hypothetical protein